ncbi:MAG: hypothetical protein RR144_03795 [Clostridia bacterium]
MLNKVKTGLNIFILFMFVVTIVYGIIMMLYNTFNIENINNINVISKENIDIYLTDKNLVKNDYTIFYSLENCIQDIITSLHENKTSDVYNILIKDIKSRVGSKEKLVEYYNLNFKYETNGLMDVIGYQNINNLKEVYKADKNVYICIVNSLNNEKNTKIGIKLLNDSTYLISYLDI